MIKILFVCHGNICRSPMAEYIMKKIVQDNGKSSDYEISSADVSREEIGNDMYPDAKRKLAEKNVPFRRHSARQMTMKDYGYYDYLIGMDKNNYKRMMNLVGNDPDHKIHLLMDFTKNSHDISDPWYTGDFETTYQDILEGCLSLFEYLEKETN